MFSTILFFYKKVWVGYKWQPLYMYLISVVSKAALLQTYNRTNKLFKYTLYMFVLRMFSANYQTTEGFFIPANLVFY